MEREAAVEHRQFPCRQCGAGLAFKPGAAVLECPYCGASTPIPDSGRPVGEEDYFTQLEELERSPQETVERRVVRCEACGAQTTLQAQVAATVCPFCGSPLVVEAGSDRVLKPKALLPFKITRQEAEARFRSWLAELWFAPGALKRQGRLEGRLAGIYVPYWTYDSATESRYRGERGDDYWESESYRTQENGKWVTRTRQVRRTRWRPVSGTVREDFNDILVLASRSLPRGHTQALEPWDLRQLVPFEESYLSGFRAERYQVGLREGFGQAKEIMHESICGLVRRDIGGDHQRIHHLQTRYSEVTFKHLLLPIWISTYQYNNKPYRFLVNGRTGEVQGERPYSWVKILLAVLAGLAVAAGIAFLISISK